MQYPDNSPDRFMESIVREIGRAGRFYRTLLLSLLGTAAMLIIAPLLAPTPWYIRVGMIWLGLSLLCACQWIYLRAYQRVKSEIRYYKCLYHIGKPKKKRLTLRAFVSGIKRAPAIRRRPAFSFTGGFLLASLAAVTLQDRYECGIFDRLGKKVTGDERAVPQDSILIRAVHLCHTLLEPRSALFMNGSEMQAAGSRFHPLTSDLIMADGACGSYSMVLCRILQALHFKTRLIQMKGADGKVHHIVLEAFSSGKWVVVDPLYDLYFIREDGRLASFDDVSRNWKEFRSQVPANYDPIYSYSGARYTNWEKVPLVMPMLRMILRCWMNKEDMDHFSLRPYLLRQYRVLQLLILAMLSGLYIGRIAIRPK
ncbi:hypothetical protein [Puia dinghuensis]|uniref:Transglutaminase-like domain-containing protein n=1 Tax=Puia dinghuensis TaxID=1792502 RepID=A0A8J2UI05_9BACT|nr:hypothetical protein [Puia dinghuensis]GGB20565.1 hypothetical protein GCM10011511_50380 [Puia dinghuensis]